MTPAFRAALKTLPRLTGREFCALAGISADTLARCGHRVLASGETQEEPPWAWLLVQAWQRDPGALEEARRRLAQR